MDSDKHEAALAAAFAKVLDSEEAVSMAKTELARATDALSLKVSEAQCGLVSAWAEVEALMNESGEFEVLLPGSATNYKIAWNSPRESVKVTDLDALPEEFVKMERKPKLKEIGEHLKGLRDGGLPLPNWAAFEAGERKLGWKAVKKTA